MVKLHSPPQVLSLVHHPSTGAAMKFRAEATTSERQLILALEKSGRTVSLRQLSDWRKEGLLPPLLNRGLGPSKGKTYYWREENIVTQAQCVHDLVARHGRHSVAALVLWLAGYSVPMPKVRRAWLQRSTRPKSWQLRGPSANGSTGSETWPQAPIRNRAEEVLLRTVMTLSGSFTAGQRAETDELYRMLHEASEALGYSTESANEGHYRLLNTLNVVLSAIESSSLLNVASEEEMASARSLAAASIRLVQALTAEDAEQSGPNGLTRLMEVLGAPFFLCILLLERTGYHDHLRRSLTAVETLEATISASPSSDRDPLLKSFRTLLEKIWRADPETGHGKEVG